MQPIEELVELFIEEVLTIRFFDHCAGLFFRISRVMRSMRMVPRGLFIALCNVWTGFAETRILTNSAGAGNYIRLGCVAFRWHYVKQSLIQHKVVIVKELLALLLMVTVNFWFTLQAVRGVV